VTRGRAAGLVVRTGSATELGRIATAVREIGHTTTPLQEKITGSGGRWGSSWSGSRRWSRGRLLRGMSPGEIFLVAVALAVASIPEGLPVVLTVTLAIGVSRMARRRAIIRSLPAVETLGSTTVIGSDKTGTLTLNEMTVPRSGRAGGATISGVGYAPEGAIHRDGDPLLDAGEDEPLRRTLLAGALANEADGDALASAGSCWATPRSRAAGLRRQGRPGPAPPAPPPPGAGHPPLRAGAPLHGDAEQRPGRPLPRT
jgi:cation-transporting P-type ATPase F